jgi:hypothetical protein
MTASLHEAGIRSCIPSKSNRKAKIRWNRRMHRECNRHRAHDRSPEDQPRYRHAI